MTKHLATKLPLNELHLRSLWCLNPQFIKVNRTQVLIKRLTLLMPQIIPAERGLILKYFTFRELVASFTNNIDKVHVICYQTRPSQFCIVCVRGILHEVVLPLQFYFTKSAVFFDTYDVMLKRYDFVYRSQVSLMNGHYCRLIRLMKVCEKPKMVL